MHPAGHALQVRHMRIRASTGQAEAVRLRLAHALAEAPWPATDEGEILLLRKLKVAGFPREIAAAAADEARRLAAVAVDGWSEGADDAPAVRFRSRASLSASLLRDILAGTAQGRWFWRHRSGLFALPRSQAVTSLLSEAPLELPAVLAALEGRPEWRLLWQSVETADAERLLDQIGRATGWSRVLASSRRPPGKGKKVPLPDLATGWRPMVEGMAGLGGLPPQDPRVMLAALMVAWVSAPGSLDRQEGAALLRGLAAELVAAAPPTDPWPEPASQIGDTGSLAGETEKERSLPPGSAQTADPSSGKSEQPDRDKQAGAAPGTPHLGSSRPPVQQLARPGEPSVPGWQSLPSGMPPGIHLLENSGPFSKPADGVSSHGPESLPGDNPEGQAAGEVGFLTHRAGLFFLLNVLHLHRARECLGSASGSHAGWRWLVGLGLALGLRPDPALHAFLAQACGLEEGERLEYLPLPPGLDQVIQLAWARFGDQALAAILSDLSARVVASRSHVDIHLRLADARLEIRRVGLDLDPGWLPWLGRVVSFHYGSRQAPEAG